LIRLEPNCPTSSRPCGRQLQKWDEVITVDCVAVATAPLKAAVEDRPAPQPTDRALIRDAEGLLSNVLSPFIFVNEMTELVGVQTEIGTYKPHVPCVGFDPRVTLAAAKGAATSCSASGTPCRSPCSWR